MSTKTQLHRSRVNTETPHLPQVILRAEYRSYPSIESPAHCATPRAPAAVSSPSLLSGPCPLPPGSRRSPPEKPTRAFRNARRAKRPRGRGKARPNGPLSLPLPRPRTLENSRRPAGGSPEESRGERPGSLSGGILAEEGRLLPVGWGPPPARFRVGGYAPIKRRRSGLLAEVQVRAHPRAGG